MQAVRNKMATLKSKLEDAEKAAQEAETDLEETIQAAEDAEERVRAFFDYLALYFVIRNFSSRVVEFK